MTPWAIAIRTAPRQQDLLPATLQSMQDAGWDPANIKLYAEPTTEIRETVRRAFPPHFWSRMEGNTRAALLSFLDIAEKFPKRHIIVAEDDVQFALGARDYLDRQLAARPEQAVYSLYIHPKSRASERPWTGWIRTPVSPKGGFAGAQAVVFPENTVKLMANTFRRYLSKIRVGDKPADDRIGRAIATRKWPVYVHIPSICQHTGGDLSTLWDDNEPDRITPHFMEDLRQWDGHGGSE